MLLADKTTKALLAAIVILLAMLVVRPMLPVTPEATAQQVIDNRIELGYRINQPSIIEVPATQFVREIQVIDSAQAFLVRYDNRIEVYRIQVLSVDPKLLQQNANR